ncbi:sensor histidine kinase [Halovenus rubra]
MDNGNPQIDALSADTLPVPVCRFRFDDGGPVVSGTNKPFDDRLVALKAGDSFTLVFDYFDTPDSHEIRTALRDGEQFTATVEPDGGPTQRYLVDVTAPTDSTAGCLLFTDVSHMSETDCTPAETEQTCETEAEPFEQGIAVDHVASVVSHDLRNPLDVARARLDAGREFDEDKHFDHVEQAHERMERIIQDVLTLARGEDVVDPDESVDLGLVAKRAWETVETNGATLTVEDELPTAQADSDRVSRLFENLFRNAVEHGATNHNSQTSDAATDATAEDEHTSTEVSVQVTVGNIADTDGFYVADDGPGIPEHQREKVLEPGYSSDEHGTGLGLAIVARIADLHGWYVDVTESTLGGAQFEIRGVDQQ